jgi:Holliday junction resolvasome RuvABC endonuclease subunit
MTMQILGKPLDLGLDATDALALAITHLNTRKINAMLERCK